MNNSNFDEKDIELMLKIMYIFQAPLPLFDSLKQKISHCMEIPLSDINDLCNKVKLFMDDAK